MKPKAILDDEPPERTFNACGGDMTRALLYDGNVVSLSSTHPAPSPLPGDAVIRPLKLSISSIDRRAVHTGSSHRGVLGHEFVGVVERVTGVDARVKAGQRVVGSIATVCGECDLCLGGLRAHCRARTLLGLHERDGCFAEVFTMPAGNLVPVPDTVDDDHAVFAHLLACAIQAARQLTIEGKPYITVLGDGPLGLLTVQVMAKLNASVRLIGKHHSKLAMCEKWGIKHRHVNDIGRRADQDVVVDCTGSPGGLELAMQLVRPRGKVLLKSLYAPRPSCDLSPLVTHEVELIGSHFGPLSEAVAMLAARQIDVVSLISRRANFSQAERAWKAAAEPGMLRVVMEV